MLERWYRRRSPFQKLPIQRLVGALIGLGIMVWALRVHAGINLEINEQTIERTAVTHTQQEFVHYVSRADCESSDSWRFAYTAKNFSGKALEVWIGESADCRTATARTPAAGATSQCTKLPEGSTGTPESQGTITISSKAIADVLLNVDGCVDRSTNTAPRTVSVFFLLLGSGAETVTEDDSYEFKDARVDLLGPAPPSDIKGVAGDGSAILTYDIQGSVSDLSGYVAFCELSAPTTSSGAGGGGSSSASSGSTTSAGSGSTTSTTATASSSATGSSSAGSTTSTTASTTASTTTGGAPVNAECPASEIVAGSFPPTSFQCGKGTGGSVVASQLQGSSLQNGATYAVGIAATDDLGNVGALSTVVCVTPEPSDDFFEVYCAERGDECKDGPGGCGVRSGSQGVPHSWWAPLAALGLFALVARKLGRK